MISPYVVLHIYLFCVFIVVQQSFVPTVIFFSCSQLNTFSHHLTCTPYLSLPTHFSWLHLFMVLDCQLNAVVVVSVNYNYIIYRDIVETSGVFGPETRVFLHKLSSRVKSFTLEEKSHFYLTQQLSIAIQRGNALSILGTHVPVGTSD